MVPEAQEFDALLGKLRENSCTQFVIDLGGCKYISSEGLGSIATCWEWCHDEEEGRMSVVLPHDAPEEVRNLFEITGIARAIGSALQPTVDDAKNYLRTFS